MKPSDASPRYPRAFTYDFDQVNFYIFCLDYNDDVLAFSLVELVLRLAFLYVLALNFYFLVFPAFNLNCV